MVGGGGGGAISGEGGGKGRFVHLITMTCVLARYLRCSCIDLE